MKKRFNQFFGLMLLLLTLGGAVWMGANLSSAADQQISTTQQVPDMQKGISVLP
jgi:CHASE3 domain sensor protein